MIGNLNELISQTSAGSLMTQAAQSFPQGRDHSLGLGLARAAGHFGGQTFGLGISDV